jgi:hypothetical protein
MKLKRLFQQNQRRFQSGFSLVEATVGLGTVTTVILALYGALGGAFSGIQFSRENLRATQILVDKMEAIRLYSWDQIQTPNFIPSTFDVPFDPQGAVNGTGTGVIYHGTVTFEDGPNDVTYSGDMKRVLVTISWTTGSTPRQRQFTSFVSRNGLQSYIY